MATNIGRVEFIVDLDGKKLPAQARKIGKEIAAAGQESGDDYSKNFNDAFERGTTDLGQRVRAALDKQGRIGGETFGESIEKGVESRSKRIQTKLADLFIDKDELEKAIGGFDDISEGVAHYERELESLSRTTHNYVDENGNLRSTTVLLAEDIDTYRDTLLDAGIAAEKTRAAQAKLGEENERLRKSESELAAEVDRVKRMTSDTSALKEAALGTRDYDEATKGLRDSLKGLHEAQAISDTDYQRAKDNLEKSIASLEKADAAEDKRTQNAIDRATKEAQKKIDADAKWQQNRVDADARAAAAIAAADQRAADNRISQNDRAAAAIAAADQRAEDNRIAAHQRELNRIAVANQKAADALKVRTAKEAQALVEREIRAQNASDKENERLKEQEIRAREGSDAIDKLAGSWRRMDGTVKLVVISIVAAADEVAVLGSAVGAGVFAIGGALAAAGVGGIGLVSLFAKLNNEVGTLPLGLRDAAKQFQDLGKAFSEIGTIIASTAIANAGGGFGQIEKNARELIPTLSKVGTMIGGLIDSFGQATEKNTTGFAQINKAIQNGTVNFDQLARTAGEFGVALLRGVNRSQPLVQDLLGWVDKLVKRFDDFTKSSAFDEWIGNARTTFGAFGGLLDALGRGLNDLVTPAAVERTKSFIDNLTAFTPFLTSFLDTAGDLDLFGLAAQGLADFGAALAPLSDPLAELAAVMNEALSVAISQFAEVAGALAPVVAVLVSGFADWIGAMDPPTIQLMATAVAVLAGAFSVMNATIAISGLIGWFKTFNTQVSKLGPVAGTAAVGIGKLAKAAGTIGLVIAGAGLLASAFKSLTNATDMVAPGVEQITQSLRNGGGIDSAFVNASEGVDTFTEAITQVAGPNILDGLKRFNSQIGGLIGIRTPVNDAADSIAAFDATLANMVSNGEAGTAANDWTKMEEAAVAQGISVEELAKKFPQYQEALAAADNASEDAAEGFDGIAEAAGITLRSIDDLSDAIRGFGSTQLSVNDAQRGFQAAIDDAQASFAEYGATLDLTTEAGRANSESLDAIAKAALESSASILENKGSQEQANAAITAGRDALILQAEQYGLTHEEAVAYADGLDLTTIASGEASGAARQHHADLVNTLEQFGLNAADADTYATKLEEIPGDVDSTIDLLGVDAAVKGAEGVKAAIDNVKDKSATLTINTKIQTDALGRQFVQGIGGKSVAWAAGGIGGIAGRPLLRYIGEAGPEAVVPLNRPLSQVDPAVRALSAFAQGIPLPGSAAPTSNGGPSSSTSRIVNIAPGAIVVQGVTAPETTATLTVNRIAARIGG